MELLKQRIMAEGRALSEHVLLVDSYFNHQVDVGLMKAIGGTVSAAAAEAVSSSAASEPARIFRMRVIMVSSHADMPRISFRPGAGTPGGPSVSILCRPGSG